MGCPRTFRRSKHANLSYERALGTCVANQEIHIATQHKIRVANQDTAEHSTTSVQPVSCENIKNGAEIAHVCPGALVFKAAPASIGEYRLNFFLPWPACSMPPLGF